MLDTIARPETSLELMLELQPEEALEWKAQVKQRHTGWHDVESASQLVALIQGVCHDGDWLIVQTKGIDEQHLGRYAQAMRTGKGYHVEVAVISSGVTSNWRIGLGPLADEAGNEPHTGVAPSQNLSLAGASEVMVSWLNGHGLPLGYGAALHVYQ
ncbi:hypothetical protein [Arthrobacter sp. ISL-65]|uniref:hypothetical protein n=1 Tax=Arthrobacter sp. ISL-65 TaxID=2819112 RepID=UPI001BE8BC4C|nr:hypothetical protein [Arthrobacter sp. ISL-65]MBT2548094.1 hypothetical protein [Arthrobacter sp. ISL-65]